MDSIRAGEREEQKRLKRISKAYNSALKTALKNQADFFNKIKDIDEGRIKPPAIYKTEEEIKKWRTGYTQALADKAQVVDTIWRALNDAGLQASVEIKDMMTNIYAWNREESIEIITDEARAFASPVFTQYDQRQIEVLLEKHESPFSKIAYNNLGKNKSIRRRLQHEMIIATQLGESQRKIIKRIQNVTGQSVSQARRVAQTERTRIQSEARNDAMTEAKSMGIKTYGTWSTRMHNSRESHIALNGLKRPQGALFHTVWGNTLEFPGDVSHGAPARETIYCFCVLVPHVLLPDEELTEDGEIVKIQVKQLSGIREALGDDYVDEMVRMLEATPERDVRDLFYKYGEKLKVSDTELEQDGAFFSHEDHGIHINKEAVKVGNKYSNPYQTVFHEFGHNIDWAMGQDNGLGDYFSSKGENALSRSVKKEYQERLSEELQKNWKWYFDSEDADENSRHIARTLRIMSIEGDKKYKIASTAFRHGEIEQKDIFDKFGKDIADFLVSDDANRKYISEKFIKKIKGENIPIIESAQLSDMLEFCSGIECPLEIGHGTAYWAHAESKGGMEFFAEVCEAKAANKKALSHLRDFFPDSVKMVEDIMREALK